MYSKTLYATILLLAATCATAQQASFSTNCTDVRVGPVAANDSIVDTLCVVTVNGSVTYQHSTVFGGQSNFGTIPADEAQKLLDRKTAWLTLRANRVLAWNTFQECSAAANRRPRKERKQARLECKSALDADDF